MPAVQLPWLYLQHVLEDIGVRDALLAFDDMNDIDPVFAASGQGSAGRHATHFSQSGFPWIGKATFFLCFADCRPQVLIQHEAFSLALIVRRLAPQLQPQGW